MEKYNGFNFAILRHESGILMISVDSLIGYFSSLEDRNINLESADLVTLFEHMLEETGYEE